LRRKKDDPRGLLAPHPHAACKLIFARDLAKTANVDARMTVFTSIALQFFNGTA